MKPELALLVKAAPEGTDWLHEIKLDGYRMHARVDTGSVKIITRRDNDWTTKYPTIAKALAGLPIKNAYVDGELCGVLPDGRTAFNLIQNVLENGDNPLTQIGRKLWIPPSTFRLCCVILLVQSHPPALALADYHRSGEGRR